MGCCSTVNKAPENFVMAEKFKQAVEADSPDRIRVIMGMMQEDQKTGFIDEGIVALKEITLNPLGYALWLGNLKAFKCLYEEFHARLCEMERLLLEKNFTALDIICQRGFTELLGYYIPLYIQFNSSFPTSKEDQNITVEFDKTVELLPRNVYTPVHKACELGKIAVLLTIFNYFKEKSYKPYTLDLEYQEEQRGKNCVLIACRTGNYSMLKFLHETVRSDFNVKNKNGETTINVCLAGNKKRPSKVYLDCLIYLIDVVGVDIKYQYEESLLLAQDRETTVYLEGKLKSVGINARKYLIEDANKIKIEPIPKTDLEMELDADEGRFNIRDYIEEEDREVDRSALSSIGNLDSHIEPFISVLGANNSILRFN